MIKNFSKENYPNLYGKRILFVCRETYSKPLWFLARDLKETSEVAAFYIMSSECTYNKCYYNEHTIFEWRENLPDVKLYDVSGICDEFVNGMRSKKDPSDQDYLDMLEREYTHFKPLGLQLMASQENTRHYHYRKYWPVTSDAENKYWLELNYKNIFRILDDFKPDVILDTDNAELQRTILTEAAYKRGIPYATIEYGKYGYYKYPSFQNAFSIDPYFRELYEENLKKSPEELSEEYGYINDFREKSSIMNKEFDGSVTSQYERIPLINSMKIMLGKWNYFWDQDHTAGNAKRKKLSGMLYAPTAPYLKYYLDVERIRRKLLVPNKYFENPVEGEKYVYMPLHLIPESSVFVKASFYVDELNLIEQVSKSLPAGVKLYVKEHQAMLGERDVSFYKRAAELPNVRVVQINYYRDPKPWITKALGVVTITGTAAYEAALLGKKAIVFGDVPFSLIKGIIRIRSFEDLPEAVRSFGTVDNIHSAASYLSAVKTAGEEVKIFYLMDEAEEIFAGRHKESPEFAGELEKLLRFYEKGLENYKSWKARSQNG
ncbi:MAG: hypothetical protein K6F86_09785 [Lachnospiraceae bacterium]|nr:hypothetical protein [Lachnospiraceae bacterium]